MSKQTTQQTLQESDEHIRKLTCNAIKKDTVKVGKRRVERKDAEWKQTFNKIHERDNYVKEG